MLWARVFTEPQQQQLRYYPALLRSLESWMTTNSISMATASASLPFGPTSSELRTFQDLRPVELICPLPLAFSSGRRTSTRRRRTLRLPSPHRASTSASQTTHRSPRARSLRRIVRPTADVGVLGRSTDLSPSSNFPQPTSLRRTKRRLSRRRRRLLRRPRLPRRVRTHLQTSCSERRLIVQVVPTPRCEARQEDCQRRRRARASQGRGPGWC